MLNSHLCCSRNEQRQVCYPRPCFANCLILPIASKRRVTHYHRVTKKKNKGALTSSNKQTKVLLWAQTSKQGCSYELKRIYIYIYIFVVSISGSYLKLLQVVLVFHLHLYLFWWGSCLELTLVSISISTSSTALACSILVGYVSWSVFWLFDLYVMSCLHIQFL